MTIKDIIKEIESNITETSYGDYLEEHLNDDTYEEIISLEEVDSEIIEHSRWSITKRAVYKVSYKEGEEIGHIAAVWFEPATEQQAGMPTSLSLCEVVAKTVTKIIYVGKE
ncbi:MAG: hypothetical protein GY679_01555 [Mycoplasma sp.]|nr:hypothetical protein [Mycoplasma sp.]